MHMIDPSRDSHRPLAATCREYGLSSVYAFGDHAAIAAQRVQAEPDSPKPDLAELDVAITTEADTGLSTQIRARLGAELEHLFGVTRVNVSALWELDSISAVDVIRGELLYCSDPHKQAQDELYILGRAADAAIIYRKSLADIHGDPKERNGGPELPDDRRRCPPQPWKPATKTHTSDNVRDACDEIHNS